MPLRPTISEQLMLSSAFYWAKVNLWHVNSVEIISFSKHILRKKYALNCCLFDVPDCIPAISFLIVDCVNNDCFFLQAIVFKHISCIQSGSFNMRNSFVLRHSVNDYQRGMCPRQRIQQLLPRVRLSRHFWPSAQLPSGHHTTWPHGGTWMLTTVCRWMNMFIHIHIYI